MTDYCSGENGVPEWSHMPWAICILLSTEETNPNTTAPFGSFFHDTTSNIPLITTLSHITLMACESLDYIGVEWLFSSVQDESHRASNGTNRKPPLEEWDQKS